MYPLPFLIIVILIYYLALPNNPKSESKPVSLTALIQTIQINLITVQPSAA